MAIALAMTVISALGSLLLLVSCTARYEVTLRARKKGNLVIAGCDLKQHEKAWLHAIKRDLKQRLLLMSASYVGLLVYQ